MSDARRKPPVLKLDPFETNPDLEERTFVAQEESTMITSLDELQRNRAAQEYSLKSQTTPHPHSTASPEQQSAAHSPQSPFAETTPFKVHPSSINYKPTSPEHAQISPNMHAHHASTAPVYDHTSPPAGMNSAADAMYAENFEADRDSSDSTMADVEIDLSLLKGHLTQDHQTPAQEYQTPAQDHQTPAQVEITTPSPASPIEGQAGPKHAQSAITQPIVTQQPQLIVFFNARGGVGCSTTAIHVAYNLHQHVAQTALVDMDLQLCSIPASLDLTLERSLAEFAHETYQSQSGPIVSAIDYHRSGLAVIAQDGRIHEIKEITPSRLPRFYEALSHTHPLIVVDGIRSFSDHAVSVMDLATHIVVMVTQDVPAIRSARKAMQLFERLGYPPSKVHVVVNRFHKKGSISLEMIEKSLKKEVSFMISNDFPFVSQIISEGVLADEINPKHKINQEFKNLSFQIIGQQHLIPPKLPWWKTLFGGKRSS